VPISAIGLCGVVLQLVLTTFALANFNEGNRLDDLTSCLLFLLRQMLQPAMPNGLVTQLKLASDSLPGVLEPGRSRSEAERLISAVASTDRTPYEEAVSDFEAAFERLVKAAGDKDEQRRAWLEATNHTFRIREFRKEAHGKAAYEARSNIT